jgi:hypothetical protein
MRFWPVKSDEPEPPVKIPEEIYQYAGIASALIESVDGLDASGEYKRHLVYARMIKDIPGVEKWKLSLAIELAIAIRRGL